MASKTEFFLDDHLIEVTLGVMRRIQPPQKHRLNPAMRSEHWWDGNCIMPLAALSSRCVENPL